MNPTLKFLSSAAVLCLVVTILSCQDAGIIGTPPSQEGPVSFSQQIQPIFNNNGCTGCHGGNGGLFLTQGQSYSNLVNVNAQASCTTIKRVLPFNTAQSVLYIRISANTSDTQCGTNSRMPKDGARLPQASIDLIRDWINSGAPNN
ncbi:MAG: hypothetical protein L0Y80_06025 [Ignavibacteriae bacterium]|nr:hypothetical protein [Ignavibacteriota bacterium]